ncbi:hypothetical protein M885DRAFT_559213 [Pelagophyceae sp. CCMP2097]|nr:hypothetical protein M885DRAFT_559213 [Pelagophyceae sp. CCMP2097]
MRLVCCAPRAVAGLGRLPRRHQAVSARTLYDVDPKVLSDVLELTGMGPGKSLADLSPSKRAAFTAILTGAMEKGQVTTEMGDRWRTDCAGGFTPPRDELIAQHLQEARRLAMLPGGGELELFTVADEVSEGNVCEAPVEDLRPISICDLELDNVHLGRVLWLTLAVDATKLPAVAAVVDDDASGTVMLYMYNAVRADATFADVAAKFPRGLRLALKQPYYRVGMGGMRQLRVDNPCNVVREDADDAAEARTAPAAAGRAAAVVVGPVRIALVEGHVRGLVTTRAVRRGEQLLDDFALASVGAPSEQKSLLTSEGERWAGSQVDLVPALVSRLADDALLRARVARLDAKAREHVPDMALFTDGTVPSAEPQISSARATRVLALHAFARPSQSPDGDAGRALFGLSSFLLHATDRDANTDRKHVGETMRIFARRDLDAGAALTTPRFDDDGTADPALVARRALYGAPGPAS